VHIFVLQRQVANGQRTNSLQLLLIGSWQLIILSSCHTLEPYYLPQECLLVLGGFRRFGIHLVRTEVTEISAPKAA